MANEDKIYIVFVRRRSGVYTTWFECQVQVIGYKGNIYKSYKTHREAVLAWVMYEPRRKKPDAPIESAEYVEGNQVIGQLVDDQVLKNAKDQKQNFLAPFVLRCVVTFTIMFFVQKFF